MVGVIIISKDSNNLKERIKLICKDCFYEDNCEFDKRICRYLHPEKFLHEGIYIGVEEDE